MGFSDVEHKFKKIGKDVVIGKFVYFRFPELSEIGDNVIIDEFCYFSTPVKIGNYIHIAPHSSVIGGQRSLFEMKDFSQMAAGCRIICGSDDFLGSGLIGPTIPFAYRAKVTTSTITLEEHAVLGAGCVVLPQVTIGEGSVVGALGLVKENLPSWGVYVGTPVKRIKKRNFKKIAKMTAMLKEEYGL